MKKCLQCDQVYGDDTNFCLSDGATLVSISDSYSSHGEAPTVYGGQSFPTSDINPPSYNTAPFTPPVSYGAPPAAEPQKSHTLLIALAVGFFALLIGGAVVGLVMYGLLKSDNGNVANVSNSADKSPQPTPTGPAADNREQKLKEQQEKIDKDKQKLEDERKALENKKKESPPTPPTPSTATTATIIDPPSNVRAAPNGRVLCVLQRRGTVVNILGPTGVTDNNGTWYYTDACGARGVIHSSQFRF
jgi:hypothetical protein